MELRVATIINGWCRHSMYYVASYANPPATNTDAGRVKVPRGRLVAGGGVGLLPSGQQFASKLGMSLHNR